MRLTSMHSPTAVIVLDNPPEKKEYVLPHVKRQLSDFGCRYIFSDSSVNRDRLLLVAFFDRDQHVVTTRCLRLEKKYICGEGVTTGHFIPFDTRIQSAQIANGKVKLTKVMVCENRCFANKRPYWRIEWSALETSATRLPLENFNDGLKELKKGSLN